MEKRQKILLGLLGLTIAVALYMQFAAPVPPAGPPAGPAQQAPGAAAPGVPGLDQVRLSAADAYRLELLAQNATGNPFYGGQGILTAEEPGGQGEGPVYSGFIQAGKKVFAVLDGIEYAAGDELADGGYRVKSIDKTLVVLERTDGSTGRKTSRSVPLVESEADKIRIRVVKK